MFFYAFKSIGGYDFQVQVLVKNTSSCPKECKSLRLKCNHCSKCFGRLTIAGLTGTCAN